MRPGRVLLARFSTGSLGTVPEIVGTSFAQCGKFPPQIVCHAFHQEMDLSAPWEAQPVLCLVWLVSAAGLSDPLVKPWWLFLWWQALFHGNVWATGECLRKILT